MNTLWMIVVWAVFGLVVGAIGRMLVPGRQPMGMLMTMVMGIIGSFVGGAIAALFTGGLDFNNPAGWIMSIVGAVIVVWAYAAMVGRRTHVH